jgi:(4S)-4-hydroxy-5-phosphonooxypentane-2,3-dione isomerase
MYIVTVLFKIHAAHWDAFIAAMHHNAQTSLAIEPGCRQFDVCEGEPGQYTVFLYEVYDTQADFTAHLVAPHFLQFNAETAAWVVVKNVHTFTRTNAAVST